MVSLISEISKNFKKIKLPGLKYNNRFASYTHTHTHTHILVGSRNIECHIIICCFGILSDYFYISRHLLNMKVLVLRVAFTHLAFLLGLMTHSGNFTLEKLLK